MRYPVFGPGGGTFVHQDLYGTISLYSGRYMFSRVLGKGTYSKVVEAFDTASNSLVALKVFRGERRYAEACVDELHIIKKLVTAAASSSIPDVRSTFLANLAFENHPDHSALVFPLAGPSIFDQMESNGLSGMPIHFVRSIAYQLLSCLALCHSLGIVHTDVKPENMLFTSKALIGPPRDKWPVHAGVAVIDFGNAVEIRSFLSERHNRHMRGGDAEADGLLSRRVIQTRHYRAPEVVFESGWSTAADMWSVGCLLPELLSGQCVFMVHRDDEHLAMMEHVIGRMTRDDLRVFERGGNYRKLVDSDGRLRWPDSRTSSKDLEFVRSSKPVGRLCHGYPQLQDLVGKLLQYDPSRRMTAAAALQHPFFVS